MIVVDTNLFACSSLANNASSSGEAVDMLLLFNSKHVLVSDMPTIPSKLWIER